MKINLQEFPQTLEFSISVRFAIYPTNFVIHLMD